MFAVQVLDHRFGVKWREQSRLGQVWQPWYAEMIRQAGLQAVHEHAAKGYGPAQGIKLVPNDRMLALLQSGNKEHPYIFIHCMLVTYMHLNTV